MVDGQSLRDLANMVLIRPAVCVSKAIVGSESSISSDCPLPLPLPAFAVHPDALLEPFSRSRRKPFRIALLPPTVVMKTAPAACVEDFPAPLKRAWSATELARGPGCLVVSLAQLPGVHRTAACIPNTDVSHHQPPTHLPSSVRRPRDFHASHASQKSP